MKGNKIHDTNKFSIGIFIWLITAYYSIIESNYFGWNISPQSFEELICDAIGFTFLIWSVIYIINSFKKKG